jgi:hypothetical protein
MDEKLQEELTRRYQAAADSFIGKLKDDPNVIAVILSGSLSYDQVWEKSDIDMTLIVRDQTLKNDSFCMVEDDITINAMIVPRSGFKRFLESLRGGSRLHSYFSKGKIVYSTEDSLYEYFEEYKRVGRDDMAHTLLFDACELHYYYEKSLKWLKVKGDTSYAQYYLLKAAEVIARMEVCLSGEIPTREAIRKAQTINPALMTVYYDGAMSHPYSIIELMNAISGLNRYLEEHLDIISGPVIDYMSDGEMKTVTMISKFFHTDSHFIIGMLDYLADQGIIAKVSQTIRITPKSKLAVEEITYQYVDFYKGGIPCQSVPQ